LEKQKKMIDIRKDLRKKHREKMKLKKLIAKEAGTLSLGPSRKALKQNKVTFENPDAYKIAIDLSFEHLMTEKDSSKCVAQLLRIYSANRRAKNPLPIYFTSLKQDSTLYKQLEKNDGWKKWDIVRSEQSYLELFKKEELVYLTSESENVLNELEKGVCYVIGGLVDHNSKKGLTYELATKNGIRTARFPLDENVVLSSRKVLTVNQGNLEKFSA
jgi:tRNA (guanine9-N1)-methyltransferase